jgi:hypothetical protein
MFGSTAPRALGFTPARGVPAYGRRDVLVPRQRFSVGVDVNGSPTATLDSNERLIVGQDENGNVVIGIEPANVVDAGTGTDDSANAGNGNAAVTASHHSRAALLRSSVSRFATRAASGIIGKMSWTQNGDGSVTFQPGEAEVLNVSGDSVFVTITATPVPAGTAIP